MNRPSLFLRSLIGVALACPVSASAHSVPAHLELLNQALPLFDNDEYRVIHDELIAHRGMLMDGAAHEDCADPSMGFSELNGSYNNVCEAWPTDVPIRFLYHFYRPIDGLGYQEGRVQFSNAATWGYESSYSIPSSRFHPRHRVRSFHVRVVR